MPFQSSFESVHYQHREHTFVSIILTDFINTQSSPSDMFINKYSAMANILVHVIFADLEVLKTLKRGWKHI